MSAPPRIKVPATGLEDPLDTMAMAMSGIVRTHFTILINESQSHLGVDGHKQSVVRRIACGEPGAVLLDGHYLLTLEAHQEECALLLRAKKPPATPAGGAHV